MTTDTTPAIRLRAMEPEDLDVLYRIENDIRLWGVSATNVPYSRYTLHDYMASASGDIYTDRQVRLIVENERHETLGMADLVNFDPRHLRAEVGIVIEQPHRNHGYARAALDDLHRYAAQVLHLHQVYAVIDAANSQALHLFTGMGYRQTAMLSDWLYDGRAYSDAAMMQLVL